MFTIVDQLHTDHKQLVRVLYHLEREIKALCGIDGDLLNLESIVNALDYIQVFPEIWHHPAEDIIYKVLREKNLIDGDTINAIIDEHSVLEALTVHLHQLFEQVVREGGSEGVSRMRLKLLKAVGDYVRRQLRHMDREQELLFPMIEQYLKSEDWDLIKQQIKETSQIEGGDFKQYQALYCEIASQSAVTAH